MSHPRYRCLSLTSQARQALGLAGDKYSPQAEAIGFLPVGEEGRLTCVRLVARGSTPELGRRLQLECWLCGEWICPGHVGQHQAGGPCRAKHAEAVTAAAVAIAEKKAWGSPPVLRGEEEDV